MEVLEVLVVAVAPVDEKVVCFVLYIKLDRLIPSSLSLSMDPPSVLYPL